MKITSLTLGGFKGIKQQAKLPLAPITLLFGANSTGKSTILHSLLYLYEILVNQNVDPKYSQLTGESVYLGGFQNLVHGKDNKNSIIIGATLDFTDSDSVWDEYLTEAERFLLESSIQSSPDTLCDIWSFELEVAWSNIDNKAYIKRYDTFGNGEHFCRFETQSGKRGSYITHYKLLPQWEPLNSIEPIVDLFSEELSQPIGLAGVKNTLPDLNKRIDLSDAEWEWVSVDEEHKIPMRTLYEASMSMSTLAPLKLLSAHLKQMLHLGPLRLVPDQSFFAVKKIDGKRWYNGAGGWDDLIYGPATLKNSVNEWFSSPEGFNTSYQFNVNEDKLERRSPYVLNTKTNIEHSMSELGVGISQVLPFVVGISDPRTTLFSCEQPELHIHPKWQLALSDLMLSSVKNDSSKLFLIETHSEHLLLRLLKRRRDTAEGELENDNFQCLKSDVQIIFCEQDNGVTKLRPISTTDEGEFDAPWPNGFFNERRGELF
jgi:hypothetical protein